MVFNSWKWKNNVNLARRVFHLVFFDFSNIIENRLVRKMYGLLWLCGNFIAGDDLFLFLLIFKEEMQWVDGSVDGTNGTEKCVGFWKEKNLGKNAKTMASERCDYVLHFCVFCYIYII